MKTGDLRFWHKNHELTPLADELQERHVPASGKASTVHGEVFRCAVHAYYDLYNNGGCNMRFGRKDQGDMLNRYVGAIGKDRSERVAIRRLARGRAEYDEAEVAMAAVVRWAKEWEDYLAASE